MRGDGFREGKRGEAVRPATRRLISVTFLALVVWTVGAVVSIVAGWPAQFGGPGDPNDVAAEFVTRGTVFAPPLFPIMILLVVFVSLVPSRSRWGTVGVVGLCLLAVLTSIGSFGEAFAPATPDVPRAVLVVSGVVGVLLSAALLLAGVTELIDRSRARRRPSRAR
jgi:hypothetical protein